MKAQGKRISAPTGMISAQNRSMASARIICSIRRRWRALTEKPLLTARALLRREWIDVGEVVLLLDAAAEFKFQIERLLFALDLQAQRVAGFQVVEHTLQRYDRFAIDSGDHVAHVQSGSVGPGTNLHRSHGRLSRAHHARSAEARVSQ